MKAISTTVNDELSVGLNVLAGIVEALFQAWSLTSFDLDGPPFASRCFKDQVNLGSCGSPIEEGMPVPRKNAADALDHESFPTELKNRVPKQIV